MHETRRPLLAAAGCCTLLVVLTGLAAFHWPLARDLDSGLLESLTWPPLDYFDPIRRPLTLPADRVPYVMLAAGLVCFALCSGRRRDALVAATILLSAPLASEVLSHISQPARHSDWLGENQIPPGSWPSGHATGGLSLALAAIVVAPQRWRRPAWRLAAAWVVLLSYSVLSLQWHYPSDVLAGFLLAAGVGTAALALLPAPVGRLGQRPRLRNRRAPWSPS